MEEFVGQLWHRIITRAGASHYPQAAVRLEEINRRLALQFRAFGGDAGLQLLPANRTDWSSRRSFLSRIASSSHQVELAWLNDDSLRLPSELAVYPNRKDNEGLYLWLAALAANTKPSELDWLQKNQRAVVETLESLPGLKPLYMKLVKAHLQHRPAMQKIPAKLRLEESLLRRALEFPEASTECLQHATSLAPVPLWLHPSPPQLKTEKHNETDDVDEDQQKGHSKEIKEQNRRKGERTDDVDGRDGLLAFRLESVMSWAEFVPVDRTADEDDEENAERVANDLDVLSITRSKNAPAARLKFDLDLPAEEYDDRVLSNGILLPEWDYRQAVLRKDHCNLMLMESRQSGQGSLPLHLRHQAKKVKAHFDNLALGKQWLRGQPEGDELDIDRYALRQADVSRGFLAQEPGLFRAMRRNNRDLSCLLLADLSLSTDAWVNKEARVIDVIRDSLHLFSEALSGTRDRFAIGGFSSKRREQVRYYALKNFEESLSPLVRQKINAIEPGFYTRMGAAIRYASGLLEKEPSSHRLLLLISDGKPNDVDIYEGRYGIEDTRHAIHEAFEKGIRVFCVTIDEKANDYLPHIFGSQNYCLIRRAAELPLKLPALYSQLTG